MIKRDKSHPLLLKPDEENKIYQSFTSREAGWDYLNFEARLIEKGNSWIGNTEDHEYMFVLLGGDFMAVTSKGNWQTKNGRKNVFGGLPFALYLPPQTEYKITATSEVLDIAGCWSPTDQVHSPIFITPEAVKNMGIEFRGGGNASRQINSILPPGSPCHRLVCVEVYTPSGNWSSYPPHKHDVHKADPLGKIIEADLEEIYFYKIDKPKGFAIQRVYNDMRSLDETMSVQNNEVVLVPEGYHPVTVAPGFNAYYLNFLAGSAQSLAASDDPDLAWIKKSWPGLDPRLPIVE